MQCLVQIFTPSHRYASLQAGLAPVRAQATQLNQVVWLQAERKAASEDMRYRALLWTWVGMHCGLLLFCADAVHGHDMHPLACLGQHSPAFVPLCHSSNYTLRCTLASKGDTIHQRHNIILAILLLSVFVSWIACCVKGRKYSSKHVCMPQKMQGPGWGANVWGGQGTNCGETGPPVASVGLRYFTGCLYGLSRWHFMKAARQK